ncbi:unnamed protein product [marine sediment metagenome]|uniref:Uncharacterized protein n=1 Tax=marine sediment metagenome TaxID=412755 RepID=X0U326_9ZZZZ
MPHYDRWDIVDAHYWHCADYHDGQFSDKYERLCQISRYYNPGPLANRPRTVNALEIYDALKPVLHTPDPKA